MSLLPHALLLPRLLLRRGLEKQGLMGDAALGLLSWLPCAREVKLQAPEGTMNVATLLKRQVWILSVICLLSLGNSHTVY